MTATLVWHFDHDSTIQSAAMGYVGCQTIEQMKTKARFTRMTGAGYRESHVHDVTITREVPNYRSGD